MERSLRDEIASPTLRRNTPWRFGTVYPCMNFKLYGALISFPSIIIKLENFGNSNWCTLTKEFHRCRIRTNESLNTCPLHLLCEEDCLASMKFCLQSRFCRRDCMSGNLPVARNNLLTNSLGQRHYRLVVIGFAREEHGAKRSCEASFCRTYGSMLDTSVLGIIPSNESLIVAVARRSCHRIWRYLKHFHDGRVFGRKELVQGQMDGGLI